MPVVSALLMLMGYLHHCKDKRRKQWFLKILNKRRKLWVFFVHICSFLSIRDACKLFYCFWGKTLLAVRQFFRSKYVLSNLDSKSTFALMSNRASSLVVVNLRAKISP